MFRNPKKKKIDKLTEDILNLTVEKKELELQKKSIEQEIQLEKEKRDHVALIKEERFESDKSNWERDMAALKARLETEQETKLTEAVTLSKLDKEQDIVALKTKYESMLQEARTEHAEEISRLQGKLSKEYYESLQSMMEKFNTEGTITTKFMSDMAQTLLEKMPTAKMEARLTSKD